MGRTRFSEAGPRRPGKNSKAAAAAFTAKNGFDGLPEAPWRKTPSIFKQPVTLVHTTSKSTQRIPEKKCNQIQEKLGKPQQIFWAKRLEGLKAMVPVHFPSGIYYTPEDEEYIEQRLNLANKIECAVNVLSEGAATASFCSALHLSNGLPITGNSKTPGTNPLVGINLNQPFVTIPEISDHDIQVQEKRVVDARKRLQELRKSFLA
ncbi:unnamed protein product [Bursaphelenchus xylophilus]|uniref:(pine wood nematode) hypothetical protein n=1 Tax=Bursaphelenchus xylophilus TaxID=6326 RepID=A0A1I7RY83_BURXY|nr:unnamed protein product [Bursaphelenchus xylophilus]CAG9085428.1 unnamed protein product [Bursaphelenchus xylophilus]